MRNVGYSVDLLVEPLLSLVFLGISEIGCPRDLVPRRGEVPHL